MPILVDNDIFIIQDFLHHILSSRHKRFAPHNFVPQSMLAWVIRNGIADLERAFFKVLHI